MAAHIVTLELPRAIYQRAQRVAQAPQRPIEQIVVEWIHPPIQETTLALDDLENLPDDELIRVAQAQASSENSHRLQELLLAQQQRTLTKSEYQEAIALVEEEDLVTLLKARALFLLKERGALPNDLTSLLT
jgi:hypothetical protein